MKSKKDLVPSIDMMGILENLGHVKIYDYSCQNSNIWLKFNKSERITCEFIKKIFTKITFWLNQCLTNLSCIYTC